MARIWLRVFLSIQKEAVKMRVALAARGNAVQIAVFFQKFLERKVTQTSLRNRHQET